MNKENRNNNEPDSRRGGDRHEMPEDVLNREQDPVSLPDPLIDQLEKSKEQNSAYENNKLEELKKNERK